MSNWDMKLKTCPMSWRLTPQIKPASFTKLSNVDWISFCRSIWKLTRITGSKGSNCVFVAVVVVVFVVPTQMENRDRTKTNKSAHERYLLLGALNPNNSTQKMVMSSVMAKGYTDTQSKSSQQTHRIILQSEKKYASMIRGRLVNRKGRIGYGNAG